MADINKINSSNPYFTDNRAIVGIPLRPSGSNYADGPTVIFDDVIRVNNDFSDTNATSSGVTSDIFPNTILVHEYATGGTGASGSPWTGWDTAITWSPDIEYKFANGFFGFSTVLPLNKNRMRLIGSQTSVLKWTGGATQAVLVQDANAYRPSGSLYDSRFENLILDGNGNATDGIYNVATHRTFYKNIWIGNTTGTGFNFLGPSYIFMEDCKVTNQSAEINLGGQGPVKFTVMPAKGISCGLNPMGGWYTSQVEMINTQINLSVNNNATDSGWANTVGVDLVGAHNCRMQGGDIELAKKALYLNPSGINHVFENVDMEGGGSVNVMVDVYGGRNTFINCNIQGNMYIRSGAVGQRIEGCWIYTLTMDSTNCLLFNNRIDTAKTGAGTWLDLSDGVLEARSTFTKIKGPAGGVLYLTTGAGGRVECDKNFMADLELRTNGGLNIQPAVISSAFYGTNDVGITTKAGTNSALPSKLIIRYRTLANDFLSSQDRYLTFNLNGSGTGWVDSATVP